jgi:hypothetical protein
MITESTALFHKIFECEGWSLMRLECKNLPVVATGTLLNGLCHEIFDLWFFRQNIPHRPLNKEMKLF